MKIKITLRGLGGELDSHTFEVSGVNHEDDITSALRDFVSRGVFNVDDVISITEVIE